MYLAMGKINGSAVVPVALAIAWKKTNNVACYIRGDYWAYLRY